MKVNGFLLFDVLAEREKRFTVSPKTIRKALDNNIIKITDVIEIKQLWIMNGDKFSGRIRRTENMLLNKGSISYEHTVKHHINKDVDYEVTTELNQDDYKLLQNLYKDVKIQSKKRVYVIDTDGDYSDYIITIDYPDDIKDECWVEFEAKDGGKKKEFKNPKWLEEKN